MIISKMIKFIFNTFLLYFIITNYSFANEEFQDWLKFQSKANNLGISDKVVKDIMSEINFYKSYRIR